LSLLKSQWRKIELGKSSLSGLRQDIRTSSGVNDPKAVRIVKPQEEENLVTIVMSVVVVITGLVVVIKGMVAVKK